MGASRHGLLGRDEDEELGATERRSSGSRYVCMIRSSWESVHSRQKISGGDGGEQGG